MLEPSKRSLSYEPLSDGRPIPGLEGTVRVWGGGPHYIKSERQALSSVTAVPLRASKAPYISSIDVRYMCDFIIPSIGLRVKPGGVGTLSVYGLSLFLIAAYLCVFLMINYNIIIYTHNFLCR